MTTMPIDGMTPYYARNGIELYQGDCREILPKMARASAHLLITDPPYGTTYRTKMRAERLIDMANNDFTPIDINGVLRQSLNTLRNYRHVYCFGAADFGDLQVVHPTEIIWDKVNSGSGRLGSLWGPQHEKILFGVHLKGSRHTARGSGKLTARLRRGSVIKYGRVFSRVHPTQKPVQVMRLLIESSSMVGETILDPFCGSAASLKAAALEGRRAIGIEIISEYCEQAAITLDHILGLMERLQKFK